MVSDTHDEQAEKSAWDILTAKPSITTYIGWCVKDADREKKYNKQEIADESPVGITTIQNYTELLVEYNILLETDARISRYQINEYSTIINSIERMNNVQPSLSP